MMQKFRRISWRNIQIGRAIRQLVNFWLHPTTCCSVIPIANSILFSANSTQTLLKGDRLFSIQKENGTQIWEVQKHTPKLLHMMRNGLSLIHISEPTRPY